MSKHNLKMLIKFQSLWTTLLITVSECSSNPWVFSLSLPIEQQFIPTPATSAASNLSIKNHFILVQWSETSVQRSAAIGEFNPHHFSLFFPVF